LTLRAVGGLTTAQIAHAFLVPEATMAQRISRAKQRIRESGAEFLMPLPDDLPARMSEVLHVLYLVFTEGHTASSGERLHRIDLTAEAIRLTRQAHALLPDDGEVAGLLALMLLTEARRRARTNAAGELVPLAEQDRSLWDTAYIQEGVALVTDALTRTRLGPYQVQASIAAVHDEAPRAADTDWEQVLATGCSSSLRQVRSCRSTVSSRSRWSRVPPPGSRCSRTSPTTSVWPGTTASTPSARTCSSWPARPNPQGRATCSRHG
jgi:predicted RNA polymerase sigma factor